MTVHQAGYIRALAERSDCEVKWVVEQPLHSRYRKCGCSVRALGKVQALMAQRRRRRPGALHRVECLPISESPQYEQPWLSIPDSIRDPRVARSLLDVIALVDHEAPMPHAP